ncbi:site-specific integrase [Proteiniphilum sp.]|uniref:tyrosine-type recombinase/integrase n=1 Tax=Proteiniphilum sp. TaxID=1926877 RepID=UPI002B214927|nr:site-specific integrase [Proteiniphilum sp.]MEA4917121.1 site-specific integrase [Proteiniphilum sp.]
MNNSILTGYKCPVLPLFREITKNKREKGNSHTASNYESVVNKLTMYLGNNGEKFSLYNITQEWVEGYIEWLKERHPDKPQTVDFYFRGFRALYNKAIKMKKFRKQCGLNPFFGLSIKKTKTHKRALSSEFLKRLLNPKLKASLQDNWVKTLDILLFSLYCRGMVFQDIYDLTWAMVDHDWQIHYHRSKTGQYICFYIPDEVREIMLRYQRPHNRYVFPFLRETANGHLLCEKSALRRINRHLNAIGRLLDIPCKLTTYVARHTWATLMLEAGKSVEIISQCLGHSSIKTTQIYLASISTTKIDIEVDDMLNRFVRPNTSKKNRKTDYTIKTSHTHLNGFRRLFTQRSINLDSQSLFLKKKGTIMNCITIRYKDIYFFIVNKIKYNL